MREADGRVLGKIRDSLDLLAGELAQRWQDIAGYDEMEAQSRLEEAQDVLRFLAASLEADDHNLFVDHVTATAIRQVAEGVPVEAMQRAVVALVDTIEPLLDTLDSALFVSRTVARSLLSLSAVASKERQALERQIKESLERRGRQVQTSAEVAQEIAAAPALGEIYRRVVTLVKERFDYYHTQLFLVDREGDRLVTVAGYGELGQALLAQGHHIVMGRGVVGRAAANGLPVLSSDTSEDLEWIPHPLLPKTRGELAVPITWREQVLGVLDVQSDRAGALTEEDQLLLQGLCGQIAIAIESTQLRQEMEESLTELERLYRSMSREGWQAVYKQLPSPGYQFDGAAVLPLEDQDDSIAPEIGASGEEQDLGSRDAGSADSPAGLAKTAGVAPLGVRGYTFGVLGVRQDEENPLSEEDLALVESVAEQVSQALEGARLFEEEQRARALLGMRVKELDCLNDIGRTIDQEPEIPDLLEWVANRIPQAMQFPQLAVAAIEFEGEVYGEAEAQDLPHQIVQALHIAGDGGAGTAGRDSPPAGRVCIAYRERAQESGAAPLDLAFLDEESALLGDITRRLTGYIQNQRLMAETREAAQRLERERFLLRTVIDNLPDHIYAKDTQSRFVLNNLAHLRVLGASSQEEVLGKTDLDVFPEELASQFFAEEQEIIRTGEHQIGHEHQIYYRATGETVWAVSTKLPLRGPDGEIYGLVGLTRDISERKQAEEIEDRRQRQLQCLSDIGRQIGASPPVPEFLAWVAERVPAAMQFPEICIAAIEFEGEIHGTAAATRSPHQMVQALHIGEERVGQVYIAYTDAQNFLDEESALLGDISRRVAGYIENRRLFEQTQQALQETALLLRISEGLSQIDDEQEMFEFVLPQYLDLLGLDQGVVLLVDPGGEKATLRARVREGRLMEAGMQVPIAGNSPTQRVLETGRPVIIEDVDKSDLLAPARQTAEELGYRSLLGVPIMSRPTAPGGRGEVVGLLGADSTEEVHEFTEREVALVQAIADQLAVALENRRLLASTEEALAEARALYDATRMVATLGGLEETLQSVVDGVARALPADQVALYVLDMERRETTHFVGSTFDQDAPHTVGVSRLPPVNLLSFDELQGGLTGWVLREGEPALSPKGRPDPREGPAQQERRVRNQVGSLVVAPVRYGDRVLGTLTAINHVDSPDFGQRDVDLMAAMSNQTAVALENARLFDEAQSRAREQMVLNEVGQALAARRDVRGVLDQVYEGAAGLLAGAGAAPLANFYITLYDAASEEMTLALQVVDGDVQRPWTHLSGADGLAEHLVRSRQPLRLPAGGAQPGKPEQAKGVGLASSPARGHPAARSLLGVPIMLGDEVLGSMVAIDHEREGAYDERSEELLLALANRTALALQNVRLLAETRAALEEVEAAHRSYLRRGWQDYLRQQALLEATAFVYDQSLALAGEQGQVAAIPDFWSPEMEEVAESIRREGSIESPAPDRDADLVEEEVRQAGRGLAVPISLRGQMLGILGVEAPAAGQQWTEEDKALLEVIGEQLAQTLESARLFAETQRRAERERLVSEITAKIRTSTDIQDILKTTATELGRALDTSRTLVRLSVGDGGAGAGGDAPAASSLADVDGDRAAPAGQEHPAEGKQEAERIEDEIS